MREDHTSKDNTVGSQQEPTTQDLAYIAGFLDGELSQNERLAIADDIISLRKENYQSHQRVYTDQSVKEILGF